MDERNEKLQAQISQLSERIAEMRGDHRAILHRLEAAEENGRRLSEVQLALQRQGDAVTEIRGKLDIQNTDLSSVSGRVTQIEKEPGERWKKIGFELIKYIVLAAAGAVIGFVMK